VTDQFGRKNLWNFETNYTVSVLKAYPEEGRARYRQLENECYDAIRQLPRERFVPGYTPESSKRWVYRDGIIDLGTWSSISQPSVVAAMTILLNPQDTDRVLEVGTASGYQAALLGKIVSKGTVFTVEISHPLARHAGSVLQGLNFDNVHVICGDAHRAISNQAKFDAIIVTAAVPENSPFLETMIDCLEDGFPACPHGSVSRGGMEKLISLERELMDDANEWRGSL